MIQINRICLTRQENLNRIGKRFVRKNFLYVKWLTELSPC